MTVNYLVPVVYYESNFKIFKQKSPTNFYPVGMGFKYTKP